MRTREASDGIGRLVNVVQAPAALSAYLEVVRSFGSFRYPGSPLIAARQIRPTDRLIAIEKHPEEAAALELSLGDFRKARVVRGDGYSLLATLLPPPERRGLVLIDPPYESDSEFHDVGRALARAYSRFATGIYLLWFPTKSAAEGDLLCGELLTNGVSRMLRLDFDAAPGTRGRDGPLTSAGLVVVNPPFGLTEEMRACLEVLEPLLGATLGARARSEIRMLADA
jgi:23S rRNA (adenine2030-N6)-methyltransferase